MARQPRPDLPDVTQHIVQRGNNRGACFFADSHRLYYLGLLGEAARKFGVAIHAYVLMTNHVHLLATSRRVRGASAMMQAVGRAYVPWVNRRVNRTGGLYEGRFKAPWVRSASYLMSCYRYIELNPVRAGMAADPADYPWSSFRCNALGQPNNLITPHALFAELGETPEQTQQLYRDFVAKGIPDPELEAMRADLRRRWGRPRTEKKSHAGSVI